MATVPRREELVATIQGIQKDVDGIHQEIAEIKNQLSKLAKPKPTRKR